MQHPIFSEYPWLEQAAPRSNDLVGMLGAREASLFYHLAKDCFSGQGTIVDAGSFLGKSACCFAQGLRANPVFDESRDRVHCFDDFVCHDEHVVELISDSFGERLAIGESTRNHFDRQIAPVRGLIEVHAGDFNTVA